MATRLLSGKIPPQTSYGLNFFDQTPTNLGGSGGGAMITPGWSPGAQCVTTLQKPPGINTWTILGWGLAFQAASLAIAEGAVPIFVSRQPQLYGGITRDSGLAEGGFIPFTQIPRDTSMIELLWDGSTEPPFPQASSASPFVPGAPAMRQKSVALPGPVSFDEDEQLQIGFFLTPMLGQNFRIWVFNATYTIQYDPTT